MEKTEKFFKIFSRRVCKRTAPRRGGSKGHRSCPPFRSYRCAARRLSRTAALPLPLIPRAASSAPACVGKREREMGRRKKQREKIKRGDGKAERRQKRETGKAERRQKRGDGKAERRQKGETEKQGETKKAKRRQKKRGRACALPRKIPFSRHRRHRHATAVRRCRCSRPQIRSGIAPPPRSR